MSSSSSSGVSNGCIVSNVSNGASDISIIVSNASIVGTGNVSIIKHVSSVSQVLYVINF